MFVRAITGTVLLALVASAASAAEKVEPALAPDPAVERVLSELVDNTAALLPPASVVGDFGPIAREFKLDRDGPRGRDFTIKMAWMPDRERAFFCGANHVAEKRWTKLAPRGAAVPDWPRAIGYFDEARNVLVINQGKDAWVYRHRRATDARPNSR